MTGKISLTSNGVNKNTVKKSKYIPIYAYKLINFKSQTIQIKVM